MKKVLLGKKIPHLFRYNEWTNKFPGQKSSKLGPFQPKHRNRNLNEEKTEGNFRKKKKKKLTRYARKADWILTAASWRFLLACAAETELPGPVPLVNLTTSAAAWAAASAASATAAVAAATAMACLLASKAPAGVSGLEESTLAEGVDDDVVLWDLSLTKLHHRLSFEGCVEEEEEEEGLLGPKSRRRKPMSHSWECTVGCEQVGILRRRKSIEREERIRFGGERSEKQQQLLATSRCVGERELPSGLCSQNLSPHTWIWVGGTSWHTRVD